MNGGNSCHSWVLPYCLQYRHSGRVTTELVDTEADITSDEQLVTQYRMSTYIEQFLDPDVSSCEDVGDKPIFLNRCLSFFDVFLSRSSLYCWGPIFENHKMIIKSS